MWGVAYGRLGLSRYDFKRMPLRELLAANNMWLKDKQQEMRDAWVRSRWAATITIMPYMDKAAAKGIQLRLPWEEEVNGGRAQLTKEQFEQLSKKLDKAHEVEGRKVTTLDELLKTGIITK